MWPSNQRSGIGMFAWILPCSLPGYVYASSIGDTTPAFATLSPSMPQKAARQTKDLPTCLFYKTIDPIEKEQISPTPTLDVNAPEQVVTDEATQDHGAVAESITEEETLVEENKISASRTTLGSLFLRQEDADRDKNVDVFGRPLLVADKYDEASTTTTTTTSAHSEEEGNDGTSPSFNNPLQENSFAQYLMNLKLQEEDNRAKAEEERQEHTKRKAKEKNNRDGLFAKKKEIPNDLPISQKTAKELDESVTELPISDELLMNDMDVLPLGNDIEISAKGKGSLDEEDLPRLSYPEHYNDRIGRDMRHLAVSIAASIDKPSQWKLFFDEGGGVLPLLECIRDGARSVEQSLPDFLDDEDVDGTNILIEQHEASFAAACTACRALRDLSALSKDFAAVVTDDILTVNARWSTCVVEGRSGYDCSTGGLISDLLTLLKHANEAGTFTKAPRRRRGGRGRRASFSLSNRRRRRDARRRCGLYVVQLLLAMVVASDHAVTTLRSTSGLIEAVVECSSYAPAERFKRKWIRKPVAFVKRVMPGKRNEVQPNKDLWVESGLTGQVQKNANKLLAAIGHNEWIPKLPGQRGLRILCLDGGGTRGIAAVRAIGHLVKAMDGVEVCDAFDMIVGTSTGAIVAFLVGLRRESAAEARVRYDILIKRIFVTSLLKPILLATTTASYDESHLMGVLSEILKDDGMLDSRANPAVPLITAVSSKMSSTPSQLCLLRNYNYGGGEMPDSFCIDPNKARQRLGLEYDDMETPQSYNPQRLAPIKCAPRTGKGSRYPGSFRVTQKIALRATTAAPTFFKPLLSFDELYVDGGIVASNPSAVAVHEARAVYPGVPLELIVSIGTGEFSEVKVPPRVGWDGVVAQILDSATDAERVHHILEDVFGEEKTAQHKGTNMASTKYFRFNPNIGEPNTFPIDEVDPDRLQDLCNTVDEYMAENEQQLKLKKVGEIIHPKTWIQRAIQCSIEKNV
mmetsp:Transcript_1393/g.2638  ORF Transcript_1393/g.2638 Transcript_1393/m.2638 type:complete len:972 (+) Transcript_1393:218-3133(+)